MVKKYQLAAATSIGVRLTPENRQPVGIGHTYVMQSTSAESNVLNVPAALGMNTVILTRFVKDSPIAAFLKGDLRRRGIGYIGPDVEQGGPWGLRHQFNIADSGFGLRGPSVYNDRAGEVGRTICSEDFDLESLFFRDGVEAFHLSGLFAALSPSTGQLCLRLAEYAAQSGTQLSFDLNHRASFWKGREAELRATFSAIAEKADVLIGNEEDFQLALGIEGPPAGGGDLPDQISAFEQMICRVQARYPHARTYATTLRQVVSANEHLWGALLFEHGAWYVEAPRPIPVLDRIGGGDGFVSGLLYGKLKGWSPERCLAFGWASGALAVTMLEDYATPVDEEQVFRIWQGNARIKR